MFPLTELCLFNDLSKARDGELNMAIDETLLKECRSPWLRFYNWNKPTISIGYFMAQEDIDFSDKPWVRRCTGGGVVTHGINNETTFSLGFPLQKNAVNCCPSNAYRAIHKKVQSVLNASGIRCHLEQGIAHQNTGNSCFENAVASDVINSSSGSKIVGGAQRRSRLGLLHQGSINGIRLSPGFCLNLARNMSENVETRPVDVQTEVASLNLARLKYSTTQWRFRK